jgi:hypothetical protein
MTIFGIFEVVFIVLREGIQIDRLLFVDSLKVIGRFAGK